MRDNVAYIIAQALKNASASVVTNVPGFGGTQVFEALRTISSETYLPSFHEEVAYSIAHGASLVGQRSATLLKAHGLAKAANSVVDSLSTGVMAGFVVLVFDDKQGKHSDSIFDVAALLKGLAIPCRSPKAPDLYHEVINAFERSEDLCLPVAMLIDCDDLSRTETYAPTQIKHSSTINEMWLTMCFAPFWSSTSTPSYLLNWPGIIGRRSRRPWFLTFLIFSPQNGDRRYKFTLLFLKHSANCAGT